MARIMADPALHAACARAKLWSGYALQERLYHRSAAAVASAWQYIHDHTLLSHFVLPIMLLFVMYLRHDYFKEQLRLESQQQITRIAHERELQQQELMAQMFDFCREQQQWQPAAMPMIEGARAVPQAAAAAARLTEKAPGYATSRLGAQRAVGRQSGAAARWDR